MAQQNVIQTDETVPVSRAIPLALQHLMAMFGATVLVPVLTGLDPGIGLMTSGVGTIIYLTATRNKIPSYLGSSFAFITPIIAAAGGAAAMGTSAYDLSKALGGLVVAGLVIMAVAGLVRIFGTNWINKLLPPTVVGSVVIVIGLGLSATAIKMAFFEGSNPANGVNLTYIFVAAVTLFSAIVFSSYFRGFAKTIPVLLGIIVGYLVSIPFGLIDFAPVTQAAWFDVPWHKFTYPTFDLGAILIVAPVALVVVVEHIGHLLVVNEITGKNFTPMLPQSLLGDGIATALSGMVGGTPSTTYAENIGVMAVTKVYATQLFWYAGAFAILIGGFIPKLGAVINSIPTPVMGGISLMLFGLIAASGLRLLVDSHIDFSQNRNLILASVVLTVGIGMEAGGFTIPIGNYTIPGMALATLLGVVLNFLLPNEPHEPVTV